MVSDLCQRSLLVMFFRLAIGSSPGHVKYMVAFKLAGQRTYRIAHMYPPYCGFFVLVVDISFGRCEYPGECPVECLVGFVHARLKRARSRKTTTENPQGNSQGPWRPTCAGWVAPPRAFIIHRNSVRELGCLTLDCSSALRCGRMQVGRNAWPRLNCGCPQSPAGRGR